MLIFTPSQAEAGIFSILGGNEALAQNNDVSAVDSIDSSTNSQTMDLLQVGATPLLALSDAEVKDGEIDESAAVNILSDNALVPATGASDVSGSPEMLEVSPEDQTSIYVVHKGDTFAGIAKMFDVSVATILAANDMKKGDKLVEGDVLLILPISGIEHTVKKGETIASIAKLYKADSEDIILYNGLGSDTALAVGDELMIPDAEMTEEGGDKPSPNLASSKAKDSNYYASHPAKSVAGYFINPVPTGHKTQGLHGPGHRGIDIGAPTGTNIYAAASGKVVLVKSGCVLGKRTCGGGYGNMVVVQHPNGTKTLYAHMTKVNTSMGASVKQGQVIGYVGSTGKSTGPHIHFEVFGAKNPGSDWSWKK